MVPEGCGDESRGTSSPFPEEGALSNALDVETFLRSRFDPAENSGPALAVRGPLSANRYSRIYRGEGGPFQQPVAIKHFIQHRFGGTPEGEARNYFAALTQLSGKDASKTLDVAAPLALLEAQGLVITSWIDGPDLQRWMLENKFQQRSRMAARAGAWLASLHAATEAQLGPPNTIDAMARLEREARELAGATSGAFFKSLELLRRLAPELALQPVRRACLHGDFKPANLIVHDMGLIGIDLDVTVVGPVVNDLAHFLNHLDLMRYSRQGLKLWLDGNRLNEAFCRGYADTVAEELPERLLLWQRLYNSLHLFLSCRDWSRPNTARQTEMVLLHQLRGLSRKLAS